MTATDDHPAVPPNIQHFAEGLRRIGLSAWRARIAPCTRSDSPVTPAPEVTALVDEVLEDLIAAQNDLAKVFAHCFVHNANKMHDAHLDAGYVERRLDEVAAIMAEVIDARHRFAVLAAHPTGDSVESQLVRLFDAFLEQFSAFAAGLSDQLTEEAASEPECVHITFAFDPSAVCRSLQQSLTDATAARRREPVRPPKKKQCRTWAWVGWLLLIVVLVWRELMKFADRPCRRNR